MKCVRDHLDYLKVCCDRELPSVGLMGSNLFDVYLSSDVIKSSMKFDETEWYYIAVKAVPTYI